MDGMEDQLAALFEKAAAHLDPPVQDLVAAGTWLGRRRRARRTMAMTAASVSVVGLTVGVVLGVQHLGTGPAPPNPSAIAAGPPTTAHSTGAPTTAPATANATVSTTTPTTATTAPSPSASASTKAAVAPTTAPASPTLVSGREAGIPLLTQLISGYGLHLVQQSANPIGIADAVYDDGHGQSELNVSVQAYTAMLKRENAYTCVNFSGVDEVPRPAGAPEPSCTKVTTADGHVEYVIVTADDGSGFYDYEVNLFTGNNMVVSFAAANGVPHGATIDVTRPVPPLSLTEMAAVVADPAWLGYLDPPL